MVKMVLTTIESWNDFDFKMGPSTIGFIYTNTSSSKSTYSQGGQFFDYEAFSSVKTELMDQRNS